jgi:hypothetical protein
MKAGKMERTGMPDMTSMQGIESLRRIPPGMSIMRILHRWDN